MAKRFTVEVEKRETFGTRPSRRLRRDGKVPAVLYGHGSVGTSVVVSDATVLELLGHSGMITVKIAGTKGTRSAIVKDVQREPLSGAVQHLDLQEVKADEMITFVVTIDSHGEPAGAQHGGQLEQAVRELEVRALPENMFEGLTVEVGDMELDSVLHVSDLELPEGVTTGVDPEQTVFQVRLPRIDEEEEEEEEEVEGEEGEEGEGGKEEKTDRSE